MKKILPLVLLLSCGPTLHGPPPSPMLCSAAQERMHALGCDLVSCRKMPVECVADAESVSDLVSKCGVLCH